MFGPVFSGLTLWIILTNLSYLFAAVPPVPNKPEFLKTLTAQEQAFFEAADNALSTPITSEEVALFKETIEGWAENQEKILSQVFEATEKIQALTLHVQSTLSPESFVKEVDAGKIKIGNGPLKFAHRNWKTGLYNIEDIPDAIIAEPRFITYGPKHNEHRTLIYKIIHTPTEIAFLIIPADKQGDLDFINSLHLYEDRIHIDGGRSRWDRHMGRDRARLWVHHNELLKFEWFPQPSLNMPEYWSVYKRATVKKPTSGDRRSGYFFGGLQAVLALTVEGIQFSLGGDSISLWPATLSFTFGKILGDHNSTYRNWLLRGTPTHVLLKECLISLLYAYPLRLGLYGFDSMLSANEHAFWLHIGIWLNVITSNFIKKYWRIIPSVQIDSREATGSDTKIIRLGGWAWNTGIPMSSWSYQWWYVMGPWFFRFLDLTNLAFDLPGTELHFPIGRIAFYMSVVAVAPIALRYAKKKNWEYWQMWNEIWENDKHRLGLYWIEKILLPISKRLNFEFREIASACSRLLSKQRK